MRLLGREGAYDRTSGVSYVEVVQKFLLYGSYLWVMSLHIERILVGFHHRVARIMMRHQLRTVLDVMWVYSALSEVMS